MTQTILHFVFTGSGGGCLVQALAKAGRGDQVIASFDDLSFGPINPSERSHRANWIESNLGRSDWNDDEERRWNDRLFPNGRKIAWLTRRSAREYAGFLEWLWRLEEPCDVVDLTDVMISYGPEHGPPRQRLALGLEMLHPDRIFEEKLWDLAEPLQATAREQHLNLWRQLRSENAPLRVIDNREFASAPMSFFDSTLISFVTENWQRVSRIVGQSLASGTDDSLPVNDLLLRARINALVESGSMEIRGRSERDIFRSEVRWPQAKPAS